MLLFVTLLLASHAVESAKALPADPGTQTAPSQVWPSDLPEQQGAPPSAATTLWLLCAIDLPSWSDDISEEAPQPTVCPAARAAMEGNWLDSAMMRLLSPIDLVRHVKKNRSRALVAGDR